MGDTPPTTVHWCFGLFKGPICQSIALPWMAGPACPNVVLTWIAHGVCAWRMHFIACFLRIKSSVLGARLECEATSRGQGSLVPESRGISCNAAGASLGTAGINMSPLNKYKSIISLCLSLEDGVCRMLGILFFLDQLSILRHKWTPRAIYPRRHHI